MNYGYLIKNPVFLQLFRHISLKLTSEVDQNIFYKISLNLNRSLDTNVPEIQSRYTLCVRQRERDIVHLPYQKLWERFKSDLDM